VISQKQRPLPDNTQHPHETDNHTSVTIRNLIPSKRATANPHLKHRGQWKQPNADLIRVILISV